MKILIDNGHGINTPGKRSPDGEFREYRYARTIAAAVVASLREKGYNASLLVPEDEDISLKARAQRVNRICDEYGKDKVILLSIHCNAAGNGEEWMKARGWCAYTTKGITQSDVLANCLYLAAEEIFTKDKGLTVRKYKDIMYEKDWEENFYLLKYPECPAVLTENFFMDNEDDVRYLISKAGRKDIVRVHVEGIEKYLQK